MTLARKVSEQLEFVEIQASKHARYANGVIVAKDSVSGNTLPPGAVLGAITKTGHSDKGKYGPVTRGEIEAVTHADNKIEVKEEEDLWNFQVGDTVEVLDSSGDKRTEHNDDDLEIEAIDYSDKKIEVKAIADGSDITSSGVYVQKADGSAKAKLVCPQLIDVTEEDALVGGIYHGAVYKDRLPNYDDLVASDLPEIAFQEFAVQGAQA